ncbi:telomere-associated protein Tap [Kitasatospora sp. NPDC006697]|uniref:telomere-associated protein Tap n=1 Tax=Kitasatospora sp. NPDC006697 TaxID=3364020 RepID=UPI0036AE4424
MTGEPDAIDALLAAGPRSIVPLPDPEERARLRTAYGLSKAETAKALGVSTSTFTAWETAQRDPQGEARAAYAKLLDGIATQLAPTPAPQQHQQPVPAGTPMLDAHPDGSLVMGPAQPCVQCGRPSVYRAQGLPMHLGGFCTPDTTPDTTPPPPPAPAPAEMLSADNTVPPAAPAPAPRNVVRGQHSPTRHPRPTPRTKPTAKPTAKKAAAKKPTPDSTDWQSAAAARYPAGPLAVLDVAPDGRSLTAYLADGTPAATAPTGRTLAEVAEWALATGLGAPRLHRWGKDGDPLVVLTDAAATELGLPPLGRDPKKDFVPRLGQLPDTHRQVKALTKAGWLLTKRGLGPWARLYRTPEDGKRVCVQFCLPSWDALAAGGWHLPEGLDAPDLARLLGSYASRVLTPRGSTAVSGLELVTALRPPTRAVRTEAGWESGEVEGSRPRAFDPAPPEVPDEHPLAEGRAPQDVLMTEAWDWYREPTDAERGAPFAVGLDVNMAFLAAASRLNLPLSEPYHELEPAFDKRIPGSWLADLSGLATDPALPSPFSADGNRPTGPAWYSTVKLAYAQELGATVQPLEGWLRHDSSPYLDPWHRRLRQAYLDTMEALGVSFEATEGDPEGFLDAMARLGEGDPAELAVLTAIKQTAKGTIGKFREKPRQGWSPGQRWPALERPTWDPLIRALVIDTATVNFHRKLVRTAADTGLSCFAVLSDCAVFAAPGPTALDVLRRPDGTLSTALRLGVSPGHVKFEGSRPMAEVLALMTEGANPARHIKSGGAASIDE